MRVLGIRAAGSIGVSRYCERLSRALAERGVDYPLAGAPQRGREAHWHLANSSRGAAWQARGRREPFVVTVHDVVPRTPALRPLYRVAVYPVVRRATAVVVHSSFAADLLRSVVDAGPVTVVPHPAARPESDDRAAARRALGWPEDDLVAVLPGVIKPAKLVAEAVAAVRGSGWRLALAGAVRDKAVARAAQAEGALIVASPDSETYEQAIVAADAVLVLRSGSVGETNGPLLDALGAGRAVVATRTGSIPEVAGAAALLVERDGIRPALTRLADESERAEREIVAAARGAALTWNASAAAHADLFAEAFAA